MIVCHETETDGRLGNQLFRIASTIGLALDRGTTPAFPASWSYRPWFSLPDEWFFDELPEGPLAASLSGLPERCAPYLQDLSLFSRHREVVRSCLYPSPAAWEILNPLANQLLGELGWPDDMRMSIHVRRGDNVTNPPGTINCLPIEYYLDAVEVARDRGFRYAGAVIFTDDFDWCVENLAPALDFGIVATFRGTPRPKENGPNYAGSQPLDWIDLALMSLCDSHVVSNSTYAWWGAYLSENPSPVYPSYWYGDESRALGFDPSLLFDDTWRQVYVKDPNPSC